MVEDLNNQRRWLVTGVRFRDVKECYPEFLASLKEGTVLQVWAAYYENGAFSNLGVNTEWKGRYVNVGVISSKMRDVAATYLDDEGFMEVRVVTDGIGDKDFWVEPVGETPLRPIAEPIQLPPLPFDSNLVPFRTDAEMLRSTATRMLICSIQHFVDNYTTWTFAEMRNRTAELTDMLKRFQPQCLHSLSKEEHDNLRRINALLKGLIDSLRETKGMAESAYQLADEYTVLEDLEHEYSKKEVCKRIYLDEMEEVDSQIWAPNGMLPTLLRAMRMDNGGNEPTRETYQEELNKVNQWLKQVLNGWYVRSKNNLPTLAHIIECNRLARRELYSYYCCEILAKELRLAIEKANRVQQIEASAVPAFPSSPTETPDDGIDPDHIISTKFNRQMVVETIKLTKPIIGDTQNRYGYLMKVMIDHRIIMIQESDHSKFARFIASCFNDEALDIERLKGSIRQGIKKMKEYYHKNAEQVLLPYWTWQDSSIHENYCRQFGEIFERNGFLKPRTDNK